ATEAPRFELKSYNVTIPMGSLSIGVDNIHHDVFLSPRFVQASRDYLFDVIRQNTKAAYFPGMELRTSRVPDGAAFRKLLIDLLQSSLTQAKYHKNIEMDLLFRLTLLKFLIAETGNQFSNLILEGKEWIRQRGEHFERSQAAHVIKARLSELQSVRRSVIRAVGQQVAQMVVDVEENVIIKARRALFGDDFAPLYDLLKNRLIFLDGGKDDVYFLEHYVLLGNYARDSDRFESMDILFQEILRNAGLAIDQDAAHVEARKEHEQLLEQAHATREDISNLESQAEASRKKLERGEGFITKFLSSADPSDVKAALSDTESRLKHQEGKLQQLGPKIDAAKQKLDFWDKKFEATLGDYLNSSDSAKLLFDAAGAPEPEASTRARLLSQLLARLESQELLQHVLAGYEIRSIAADYSPPVHLQQLRKALVSKDEMKRVAQVLKHVPAKKLSLKPIEDLSKRINRYSRDEIQGLVLKFAGDFLHLRRDLRDAEHLTACMERIHLVTTE
ncbi:MAG: hypothetical protein ABLQ96_13165, partial [Candidatus Acidiferrum sp.]